MTWLLFALATAAFYGVQGAWSKGLTRRVSELAGTWALFAFSFPCWRPPDEGRLCRAGCARADRCFFRHRHRLLS